MLTQKLSQLGRRFTGRIRLDVPEVRQWKTSSSLYHPTRQIIYEPSVNLAVRDLLRPGQTVFDAGAHTGWLTVLMSRLVGPSGLVFSFEANPNLIDELEEYVRCNLCTNVQIVPAAVFRVSDETLTFYLGDHSMAGSLSQQGSAQVQVRSVSLGDVIREYQVRPALIKMDIEGAEHDALLGMEDYIRQAHPHFVLEQNRDDLSCWMTLRDRGYAAFDLNNYQRFDGDLAFPPGAVVRNMLFIHRSRLDELWFGNYQKNRVLEISPAEWTHDAVQGVWRSLTVELEPGRYVITSQFTGAETTNTILELVLANGMPAVAYAGSEDWLRRSYFDMPLHLHRRSAVGVEYQLQSGSFSKDFRPGSLLVDRFAGPEIQRTFTL